jgi:hypothetical protein
VRLLCLCGARKGEEVDNGGPHGVRFANG